MSMYEDVLEIDASLTSRWDWESQWKTMASGHDEEWAYRKMLSLQGGIIPRAYGFFQVMLPHGESSVAFIMEKIDSVPYPTITKRLLEHYNGTDEAGEALKAVVYTLLAADHAVHTCGITSLDEDGLARNLLWQRDSYMAGTAVPCHKNAPLPAASYRSLAFQRAVLVLRALDFGENLIEAWLESLTESPDVEDAHVVHLDEGLSYEAKLLRLFDVPYERAKRYPGMLEWWQ
ncbi:hypothetical protein EXIGLDRAFT_769325 [Exidia glandulosa HHB12029]|uniref:Uncharacterized protein n=1 Tax=Exidia glandulosa HHB12029 TaxID=1314781 RepID=A0A165HIU2_EXIGL|nr:hypothetical protein EXIGLDRAFT_769325 [Exidia glandulosa HHB12029]